MFFFLPDDGNTMLQPLWIEDLVTSLMWSYEEEDTRNQVYSIGGPEYITFRQVVESIVDAIGIRRRFVSIYPPYLRAMTVLMESLFPGLPTSVYWLDYLAVNRTCALDTIPRQFSLMPGRFKYHLDHLRGMDWRRSLLKTLLRSR
jgi:NADH dehydrogenase